MREKELREHAKCSKCKEGIGHTGLPLFWSIEAVRYGLDHRALQRQTGLEMMIGVSLTQVMGPDEELANEVSHHKITLCEACAIEVMELLESCDAFEDKEAILNKGGR